METEDAARLMGMKPAQIAEVYEVEDGTLVVSSEGAQTLIDADGRCTAVFPRRELPEVRVVEVLDVRDLEDSIDVADVVSVPPADEQPNQDDTDTVPDATAEKVLEWAGEDKDRLERALDAELKRESPRTTLVSKLSNTLAKIGSGS